MRLPFLMILLALAACEDEVEEACTDGEARCDGDVLQECIDEGWEDLDDCAVDGLVCHEEMGHCMDPDATTGG